MFGLGFGEIMVLLLVGIVVVGPKRLPTLMRTAGRWVGKLRRMSHEFRAQSGIDDLVRLEGLENEVRELRTLTQGNMFGSIINATAAPYAEPMRPGLPAANNWQPVEPLRDREYPLIGCDAYDALADDVEPYLGSDTVEAPQAESLVTESPLGDGAPADREAAS